jgi:hypothetical protein
MLVIHQIKHTDNHSNIKVGGIKLQNVETSIFISSGGTYQSKYHKFMKVKSVF